MADGRADFVHDRRYRALVLLAPFASLRWGEVTALRDLMARMGKSVSKISSENRLHRPRRIRSHTARQYGRKRASRPPSGGAGTS